VTDSVKRVQRSARIVGLIMAAIGLVAALLLGYGYPLQDVVNLALAILLACVLVNLTTSIMLRRPTSKRKPSALTDHTG
jgi:uncharacterized membrane protein